MAAKKSVKTKIESTSLEVHPRVAFIKSIKFAGIGLDQSHARIDRLALADARDAGKPMEIELKLDQSVLAQERDFFIVAAEFDLTQRAAGSKVKIVSIAATFSARFDLTAAANADLANAFAKVEARLIFFPYIRHFVSDTSYRMAIDPIVLPMTSELEG